MFSSRVRWPFAWLPVDKHYPGSWRVRGVFGDEFPLSTRSLLNGTRSPVAVIFHHDGYDLGAWRI